MRHRSRITLSRYELREARGGEGERGGREDLVPCAHRENSRRTANQIVDSIGRGENNRPSRIFLYVEIIICHVHTHMCPCVCPADPCKLHNISCKERMKLPRDSLSSRAGDSMPFVALSRRRENGWEGERAVDSSLRAMSGFIGIEFISIVAAQSIVRPFVDRTWRGNDSAYSASSMKPAISASMYFYHM